MQAAFHTFYEAPHYPFPIRKYLAIVSACCIVLFLIQRPLQDRVWRRLIVAASAFVLTWLAIFHIIPDGNAALAEAAWRRGDYETVQDVGTMMIKHNTRGTVTTRVTLMMPRGAFSYTLQGYSDQRIPNGSLMRVTIRRPFGHLFSNVVLKVEQPIPSAAH